MPNSFGRCPTCCQSHVSDLIQGLRICLTFYASAAVRETSNIHVIVSPALSSITNSQPDATSLDHLRAAASPMPPPPQILSSELCCLPFSSGTTGVPKGVMLSHRHALVSSKFLYNFVRVPPYLRNPPIQQSHCKHAANPAGRGVDAP